MSSILRVNQLTKKFGTHYANNDITFEVPEGSIFGLLGPNGAGKTTLIRTITQIIGIDEGEIWFKDHKIERADTARIGYMPEERGLYKKMKVGEHLVYLARLKGLSKADAKTKINYWMEKFDIQAWWNKRIEELSKGMQQKIQFIATVVHEPPILILDEPFSGLDPINTNLIKNEIFELREKGTTIIFSTHRMEQVEEICEEIVLINNGRKILDGGVADLKDQFKENVFELGYRGELSDEILGNFKVLERENAHIRVQLDTDEDSKAFLRHLVGKNVGITSFNEILPTLNEIFIKQVEQTKHG